MTSKSVSQIESMTGQKYNEGPSGPLFGEEDYTPELGDIVEFTGFNNSYGKMEGRGEVVHVFKNGKINVKTEYGEKYTSSKYELLSRAG